MSKSRPSRSSLAVPLLAGSLCLGSGCVSAPQPVAGPPPSPIPCPKGTARTYKLHGLETHDIVNIQFETTPDGRGVIRKGEVLRVQLALEWGDFPQQTTMLLGQSWFGKDRVYGRLTQVILPSGESLPICADLNFIPEPGIALKPGSTPTVAYINIGAWAKVVPESRIE